MGEHLFAPILPSTSSDVLSLFVGREGSVLASLGLSTTTQQTERAVDVNKGLTCLTLTHFGFYFLQAPPHLTLSPLFVFCFAFHRVGSPGNGHSGCWLLICLLFLMLSLFFFFFFFFFFLSLFCLALSRRASIGVWDLQVLGLAIFGQPRFFIHVPMHTYSRASA